MKRFRAARLMALLIATGIVAKAQVPADAEQRKAFREQVVKALMERIGKRHFAPRPANDAFSAAVYKKYLQTLDPGSGIFLAEDIRSLAVHERQIDDQLRSGGTAFFDAVFPVYARRAQEVRAIYTQFLQSPVACTEKDSVIVSRKDQPFPVTAQERQALWHRLLKYHVLRSYMEMKEAAGDTDAELDTAMMTKARLKVKRWYDEQFRPMEKPSAADDKFTLYLAVATQETDPHTLYSAPKDKTLEEMLSKRYFGLGLELSEQDADFYIKRLLPGGTAARSGTVKENDIVISVSDPEGRLVTVSGMAASEVAAMIRGEKGSEVQLMLRQKGEPSRLVRLQRDEVIDMENRARGLVLEKDGRNFGYIHLPVFYIDPNGMNVHGAAADVSVQLEKLKGEDVAGIVIDLRGNGGGSLDEVVRMAGFFLPGGPVTWLRTREGFNEYVIPAAHPAYEGPLTVLVDESSASASEIFAAVIQDRSRGIVLGPSSTFGKGTAQMTVNLGKMGDPESGAGSVSYGSLRLTMQKFYRVNGTSTQLKGVIPDIILQERMVTDGVMEKDYSASLACDTITLTPFEKWGPAFDYERVVASARKRVAASPAFTAIGEAQRLRRSLAVAAVPVEMAGFRQYYRRLSNLNRQIADSQTLPQGRQLLARFPEAQHIRPDLRQPEPVTAGNAAWAARIAKDLYVAEAVSVLEDICSHPLTAVP